MRAVEKTPWAVRRTSMHDSICLAVAEDPMRVIRLVAPAEADLIGETSVPERIDNVTIEAECGIGFCDVLVETDQRSRAWFIEVKTDDERASAGDIIRQLRWYSSQRRGFDRKELILVSESLPDPKTWMLLLRGGVRVLPAYSLNRPRGV